MQDPFGKIVKRIWRDNFSGLIPTHLQLRMLLGLLTVLVGVWLSCAPASPAIEGSTPAGTLQRTVIATEEPETFSSPAAPKHTSDALPQDPESAAANRTLSGGEPVASSRPRLTPSDKLSPKSNSRQIRIEAGESEPTGGSVPEQPAQVRPYTWRDGDRRMTVLLQPDLMVTQDGDIESQSRAAIQQQGGVDRRDNATVKTTRSQVAGKAGSDRLPVFRSQSGTLMTLPGGILLALDETWGAAKTDSFFERNGIAADRVSELEYLVNGFYVETEPGFPSLELANSLAEQDGVRISTPNWQRDLVAR